MTWENVKKTCVRVLSILILFLTFGLWSLPGAEAQVQTEIHQITSPSDKSDNDILNDLKERARADYRENISKNEGSSHGGASSGPVG